MVLRTLYRIVYTNNPHKFDTNFAELATNGQFKLYCYAFGGRLRIRCCRRSTTANISAPEHPRHLVPFARVLSVENSHAEQTQSHNAHHPPWHNKSGTHIAECFKLLNRCKNSLSRHTPPHATRHDTTVSAHKTARARVEIRC